MKAEVQAGEPRSSAIPDLPLLGFRNYWYPVIESRKLKGRPVPVRVLGEDLVLFRSDGKVGALVDRCPHRGTRLSLGRVIFPGTLSCGYHGWTFDRKGECLAALVEGPDSKIPGKVRVTAYPVEERFGIVWVFMGEGEAPPLEEDLAPDALAPDIPQFHYFEEWDCDWRTVTENIVDASHPFIVHRNSFVSLFQKVPAFASRYAAESLPDGKGVLSKMIDVRMTGDYPGLGRFPSHSWWRRMPLKGGFKGLEMRMPGYILVRRQDPYFGFLQTNWQWPYPVDEHRARLFFFTMTHPTRLFERVASRILWHVYHRPARIQFVNQDRRQLEPQNYRDPEKLSAGDAGLIHFRRFAAKVARQPSPAGQRENPQAAEPRGSDLAKP